jgi:hypothetical protein
MNYPKIGPVRVFALDKTIMVILAEEGNTAKLTPEDAHRLAEALESLANAVDTKKETG